MVMFHSHVKLQAGKMKHSNDNQMRKISGVVGARKSASNLRPLPKGGFIQFHPHTQQSEILLDEGTTALLLINALALLLVTGRSYARVWDSSAENLRSPAPSKKS